MPSCVIVVENLPVPFDRRVWQEANALKAAGWTVSVICPTSERHPEFYEEISGIAIFRHALPTEAKGKSAFILEYSAALFHEFRLLLKVYRRKGFDVIQACNPPDLIFLPALPFKMIGKKFVFDHHDVSPELYLAKFEKKGFMYRMLLLAERLTFRMADLVISANETYRCLAIERGGKSPDDVVTVYSVPDPTKMQRMSPDDTLRRGARIVVGYVGIIGDQDGLDHLVHCARHLYTDYGMRDICFLVVGDGPALESVRELARSEGVDHIISFLGYRSGADLATAISTFDIGLIPDPVNDYNDKISMNKVFEYAAFGIPSVSYDLSETRRLLGPIGSYAADATPLALAQACLPLIQDNDFRLHRGRDAKALADAKFDWVYEADKLVKAYERFL